ncbi:PDZ domain-containing protein [Klebsiella pneumoniae subsp. pneumoniae]|nr:PDZ domain-containing protein [Klebsiella pneumoniae subsp. pneumoniae]
MRVVPQLRKRPASTLRPALGIEVDEQLNTRLQALTGSKGVFVLRVTPGSAAHRAGLVGVEVTAGGIVPGDRVISIDGIAVDDVTTLQARLDDKNVGDVVVLLVERARQDSRDACGTHNREFDGKWVMDLHSEAAKRLQPCAELRAPS